VGDDLFLEDLVAPPEHRSGTGVQGAAVDLTDRDRFGTGAGVESLGLIPID